MKQFGRISSVVLLLFATLFLYSCSASDSYAQEESDSGSGRYAMSTDQIKNAAKDGDADAQYALGFMYYYGKQVPRDMDLARSWIRKAAAQGQVRAKSALKLLGDKMPTSTPKLAENKETTKTKLAAMKKTENFSQAKTKTSKVIAKKSTPKSTMSSVKHKVTTPKTQIASNTGLSATAKRLLKKQSDHFTLQILGSHNLDQVQSVIEQNHLAKDSSIYHTYFKGKDWYVLIYGDYKNPDDALAAIDRLPPMAQQLKPWVKPFASVKVGIKTRA